MNDLLCYKKYISSKWIRRKQSGKFNFYALVDSPVDLLTQTKQLLLTAQPSEAEEPEEESPPVLVYYQKNAAGTVISPYGYHFLFNKTEGGAPVLVGPEDQVWVKTKRVQALGTLKKDAAISVLLAVENFATTYTGRVSDSSIGTCMQVRTGKQTYILKENEIKIGKSNDRRMPISEPENYQRVVGYLLSPENKFPVKRMLIVHPTGSGKTITIWEVLNAYIKNNDKIVYNYWKAASGIFPIDYSSFLKTGVSRQKRSNQQIRQDATTQQQVPVLRKLIVITPTSLIKEQVMDEAGKVRGYMSHLLSLQLSGKLKGQQLQSFLEGASTNFPLFKLSNDLTKDARTIVQKVVSFHTYVNAGNYMPFYEDTDDVYHRHASAKKGEQEKLTDLSTAQRINSSPSELLPEAVRADDNLFSTYNPFNHSVVCMDEFHNLVNTKSTDAQWVTSLNRLLYTLKQATDCVIVGFTATPIVATSTDLLKTVELLSGEPIDERTFTVTDKEDPRFGELTSEGFRKTQGYISMYSIKSDFHLFPRQLPPLDSRNKKMNQMFHPPEFVFVPMSDRLLNDFKRKNTTHQVVTTERNEEVAELNTYEAGKKNTVFVQTSYGVWERAWVVSSKQVAKQKNRQQTVLTVQLQTEQWAADTQAEDGSTTTQNITDPRQICKAKLTTVKSFPDAAYMQKHCSTIALRDVRLQRYAKNKTPFYTEKNRQQIMELSEIDKQYKVQLPADCFRKVKEDYTLQVYSGDDQLELKSKFIEPLAKEIAPKLYAALKNIAKTPGKQIVFSPFNTGLVGLASMLESVGYERCDVDVKITALVPKPRFVLYDPASKVKSSVILRFFQGKDNYAGIDNTKGQFISVLLLASKFSEGLDFKEVRAIHMLNPPSDMRTYTQMVGRGIRNCSHMSLPRPDWNTHIYMYLSTFPANTPLNKIAKIADAGDEVDNEDEDDEDDEDELGGGADDGNNEVDDNGNNEVDDELGGGAKKRKGSKKRVIVQSSPAVDADETTESSFRQDNDDSDEGEGSEYGSDAETDDQPPQSIDASRYRATTTFPMATFDSVSLDILRLDPNWSNDKKAGVQYIAPDVYVWIEAVFLYRGPAATLRSLQRASVDCIANSARTLIKPSNCGPPTEKVDFKAIELKLFKGETLSGCDINHPKFRSVLEECFKSIMQSQLERTLRTTNTDIEVFEVFEQVYEEFVDSIKDCTLRNLNTGTGRCILHPKDILKLKRLLKQIAHKYKVSLEIKIEKEKKMKNNILENLTPHGELLDDALAHVLIRGIPPLPRLNKDRQLYRQYIQSLFVDTDGNAVNTGDTSEEGDDAHDEEEHVITHFDQVTDENLVEGTIIKSPLDIWNKFDILIKQDAPRKVFTHFMPAFEIRQVRDIYKFMDERGFINPNLKRKLNTNIKNRVNDNTKRDRKVRMITKEIKRYILENFGVCSYDTDTEKTDEDLKAIFNKVLDYLDAKQIRYEGVDEINSIILSTCEDEYGKRTDRERLIKNKFKAQAEKADLLASKRATKLELAKQKGAQQLQSKVQSKQQKQKMVEAITSAILTDFNASVEDVTNDLSTQGFEVTNNTEWIEQAVLAVRAKLEARRNKNAAQTEKADRVANKREHAKQRGVQEEESKGQKQKMIEAMTSYIQSDVNTSVEDVTSNLGTAGFDVTNKSEWLQQTLERIRKKERQQQKKIMEEYEQQVLNEMHELSDEDLTGDLDNMVAQLQPKLPSYNLSEDKDWIQEYATIIANQRKRAERDFQLSVENDISSLIEQFSDAELQQDIGEISQGLEEVLKEGLVHKQDLIEKLVHEEIQNRAMKNK